jgi:hypothetical protein
MGSRSNYHAKEVRALVEGYAQLREAVTASPRRLWLLVRTLDLVRAFTHAPLTAEQRRTLFWCGIYGLTQREQGALEGVSQPAISVRYDSAIAVLTTWLNGGNH